MIRIWLIYDYHQGLLHFVFAFSSGLTGVSAVASVDCYFFKLCKMGCYASRHQEKIQQLRRKLSLRAKMNVRSAVVSCGKSPAKSLCELISFLIYFLSFFCVLITWPVSMILFLPIILKIIALYKFIVRTS